MEDIESRLAALEVSNKFIIETLNKISVELSDEISLLREQLNSIDKRLGQKEIKNGVHETELNHTKKKMEKLEDEINTIKRYFWVGLGAVSTLQVFLNYLLGRR